MLMTLSDTPASPLYDKGSAKGVVSNFCARAYRRNKLYTKKKYLSPIELIVKKYVKRGIDMIVASAVASAASQQIEDDLLPEPVCTPASPFPDEPTYEADEDHPNSPCSPQPLGAELSYWGSLAHIGAFFNECSWSWFVWTMCLLK